MSQMEVFDAFFARRSMKEGELYAYAVSYEYGSMARIGARIGYGGSEFASYWQEPQYADQPRQLGLFVSEIREWYYTETEMLQFPELTEKWRRHNAWMDGIKDALFKFRTVCDMRSIRYNSVSEIEYWSYR